MSNLFNKILFKSRLKTTNENTGQNPWVKKGELIYLHSKKGLFEVTSVSEDGFYVIKENAGKSYQPEFHKWENFRRWSSRSFSSKNNENNG